MLGVLLHGGLAGLGWEVDMHMLRRHKEQISSRTPIIAKLEIEKNNMESGCLMDAALSCRVFTGVCIVWSQLLFFETNP